MSRSESSPERDTPVRHQQRRRRTFLERFMLASSTIVGCYAVWILLGLTVNAAPVDVSPVDVAPVDDAPAHDASPPKPLPTDCPGFVGYAGKKHEPLSKGKLGLPFQRPRNECRTFPVPEVEEMIDEKIQIQDPDLFRLFENAWPNTVDTTIKWTGVSAENPEEELAFVTTGDIPAMWLRDSANQLQSYKSLLTEDTSTRTASLYRGVINLQARYIRNDPYCNAYRAPDESGLGPKKPLDPDDKVKPPYNRTAVWECKYELDSLAAFLQLSWDYHETTGDDEFFAKFGWEDTVKTILDVVEGLQEGTYSQSGDVIKSPYKWHNWPNGGYGEPVMGGSGLVRSFFRPSDDPCTFQYLIPANMMISRYLDSCAEIMESIDSTKAERMKAMGSDIRKGIEQYAIVEHAEFGRIYAYEIDGFGSFNLMDDANLPSLLSIPHMGYKDASDEVYQNTRQFALSKFNRYYAYGPVLNATGGPHLGPARGWPMGVVMQILTSDDEDEMENGIRQLLSSTDGLGLIHESVHAHDEHKWTRPWFAWANGLFGQMILDVANRKPALLEKSYH